MSPGGTHLLMGHVLEFGDGGTLCDEGDTRIFGDMSLIEEFYHPNIILMGCRAAANGQYARIAWLQLIITSKRKWLFQCTTARYPICRARQTFAAC